MEQVTNDEFYVKLGSILRELREQKGLTQQEVADKIGVTRAAVANYENGLRAMYAKNLIAYCRVVDANVDWVLNKI